MRRWQRCHGACSSAGQGWFLRKNSRISYREVSPFLEGNCVISSMILQYTYDNDVIVWENTNDFTIYITYDNDIII